MIDEQILEIAEQLYGGPVSEEALRNHKTIAFARLIEKQAREDCAVICMKNFMSRGSDCAAAIRKGGE
jgi:hypothetical protein